MTARDLPTPETACEPRPTTRADMHLVIVSGLSGAGKTVALRQYEDLGFYCIDNLPLALVPALIAEGLGRPDARYRQLAIGADARAETHEIDAFPAVIDSLRDEGVNVRVLFLTASDEVILRRYHETRRRHPLSGERLPLLEAIRMERRLLEPIADLAGDVIDTSAMNLHQLRSAVFTHLPDGAAPRMAVQFQSFGYKNGLPDGADFVFDLRSLPNPHWVPNLRALTGLDAAVADYLDANPDVGALHADIREFLERWLPKLQAQDRAYVTVALGCTGGQHRSVYMVERLARDFGQRYETVTVQHRELALFKDNA